MVSVLMSGSCRTDLVLCLPGLASNVVPMFLGEMSPRNLRGAIGIVPQLFITLGILIAQILGLTSILGHVKGKALAQEILSAPWGKDLSQSPSCFVCCRLALAPGAHWDPISTSAPYIALFS